MGEYVLKRQNTVTQYIFTRPIRDLCKETVGIPGSWFTKVWWDQEGLDLVGAMEATAGRDRKSEEE